MKTEVKLVNTIMLLATPLAANAESILQLEDRIVLFGGGAAGGFLGALLACWLCKRFGSKNDRDPRK